MKIAYVFEDTHISGGNRVTLAQADALVERGHEVTLITKGERPSWRTSRACWMRVAHFEDVDASPFDFMIGTFWTTVPQVYRIAGRRAVHLCQGYEGAFAAYREKKDEIDAVYRLPIPKLVVSPHLVDILRPFTSDITYVGQIVDDVFFREPAPRANARPRVLLVGPALKGVGVGYDAVRAAGVDLDLIRVSPWPAERGEPAELAKEFHVGLSTGEMANLIGTCDAYLAPTSAQEGFGLPAAEAMAGGVPGIVSEIPSYLAFDAVHDYALFAPENDAPAMGAQLSRLLGDEPLRESIARRGREVVEQFRAARTGERLERFFGERASGPQRSDLRSGR